VFKTLFEPAVDPWVFKPPFTTRAVGQGTGLGLSTVFKFVKQSEGKILVQPEVEADTTFPLFLPRHRND